MGCRDVSGLSWVGDSKAEGPGALGATRFLNKGSFPCSLFPLGSGYDQRDGTEGRKWLGWDIFQAWRRPAVKEGPAAWGAPRRCTCTWLSP